MSGACHTESALKLLPATVHQAALLFPSASEAPGVDSILELPFCLIWAPTPAHPNSVP